MMWVLCSVMFIAAVVAFSSVETATSVHTNINSKIRQNNEELKEKIDTINQTLSEDHEEIKEMIDDLRGNGNK